MVVERMVKKGVVILAALILGVSSAMAANVETMGIGAMNTAVAGAVAAYCDNVYAAYYNPAGLTLIEKPTVSTGALYYNAKVKISDWDYKKRAGSNTRLDGGPTSFESDTMNLLVPDMGFSVPVSKKLTFGMAAYAPYGLHVTWEKDPSKNPGAAYAWESKYGRFAVTPTLAYKISDKLSVGVGVSLGRSESKAGKTVTYQEGLVAKSTSAADVEAAIQGAVRYAGSKAGATKLVGMATLLNGAHLTMDAADDFNHSFNVGMMYRPVETFSFGLTFRSRTEARFEGDVNITGASGGAANYKGEVEMDYDHPEQLQAGVRWFATPKLSVEFDTTWTGWSTNKKQVEKVSLHNVVAPVAGDKGGFETVVIDGVEHVKMAPTDMAMSFTHDRNWKDTFSYRLGVIYEATPTLTLRGGYAYDPSPVPDATFDLGWPDTDRNMFSFGLGWKISDTWTLDAVLQHVRSTKKRAVSGSKELDPIYSNAFASPTGVSLKDQGILWGAGVTLTYSF